MCNGLFYVLFASASKAEAFYNHKKKKKVRSRTKSLVRIGQGAELFPDKGGEGIHFSHSL